MADEGIIRTSLRNSWIREQVSESRQDPLSEETEEPEYSNDTSIRDMTLSPLGHYQERGRLSGKSGLMTPSIIVDPIKE